MASIDYTTWAALVGTWVLVVGTLAFAYWQLRQNQRLHSASTLLDLRERFYGPRMREARRELATWLLRTDRGEEIENWEVGVFFELLGNLTRSGVLDGRMVWKAFGSWVTAYYTLTRAPTDYFEKWRSEANDPLIFADFEWLARKCLEFDRGAAGTSTAPRVDLYDARYVLDSESHLGVHGPPPAE